MSIVFLDTETTGLDHARHQIWEIGLIERADDGSERECLWQLHPDMTTADATGLRIGRYYQRNQAAIRDVPALERVAGGEGWFDVLVSDVARDLAFILDGAHVVGAVPSFDANFLDRFLRANGQAAAWHYHLIDVENVAVGYLAGRRSMTKNAIDHQRVAEMEAALLPPYNSDELARLCGVPPISADDRHTALGDARWVRAWWDVILGGRR